MGKQLMIKPRNASDAEHANWSVRLDMTRRSIREMQM